MRVLIAALGIVLLALAVVPVSLHAQSRHESNVIYGMYSGLALLMDVEYPDLPNGFGIVTVGGTGWHLPVDYDGIGQKDRRYPPDIDALLAAGYTVFRVNHRAAPRFRYPTPLDDVHRAMPADLTTVSGQLAVVVASLLGSPPFSLGPLIEDRLAIELARQASPLHHVSADAAPFLLEHGDADELVPFTQSLAMERALQSAGVAVELRRVVGGDHGGPRYAAQDPHTRYQAIIGWLDRHLRTSP